MILYYNRDRLYRHVPDALVTSMTETIHALARAVADKQQLDTAIIQTFNLKKMQSTDAIFKFRLPGAYRCLVKYIEHDSEVFEGEPGLILLEIVEHDAQGRVARHIEGDAIELASYEAVPLEMEPSDSLDATEQALLDADLSKAYLRMMHVAKSIPFEDFMTRFNHPDRKALYPLSENQRLALEDEGPTLMMGCAGSGKTLVLIARALKQAHYVAKQGYFTFTSLLKESAAALFHHYSSAEGIEGQVDFHVIKDFMLEQLGLTDKQYFSLERYLTWYHDTQLSNKYLWLQNIGPIDLWIEIRGLIKGYAGHGHVRIKAVQNMDQYISKTELQTLRNSGIIRKAEGSHGTYIIEDEAQLLNHVQDTAHPLRRKLHELDRDTPLMSEFEYVEAMHDKYTEYDEDTRKKIYTFARDVYQKHLETHTLYDDNDLARGLLKKIDHRTVEFLDFVFIDELQDLTELQTLALAKLATNPQDVMMSGDVSQIINPTFFVKGRIGLIFRNRLKTDLNQRIALEENYRNSTAIVTIVKKLLTLRQDILGTYNEDIVEDSIRLEKSEGIPYLVHTDNDNMLEVMHLWLNVPKVAIIVASTKTKKTLLKHFGVTGETNIYTVQEVKGQEFDKTILYNILTEHRRAWEDIMDRNIDKSGHIINRHRYYFNLFYVALTRSIDNVFLYENHTDLQIYQALQDAFEPLEEDLSLLLDIKEYQSEAARRTQAEDHFIAGDYARARTYYRQLNDPRQAAICTGHIHLQAGRFNEAVAHLYQFREYHETAYTYVNDDDLLIFKLLIGRRLKKLDLATIDTLLSNKKLIDLCTPYRNTAIHERLIKDALKLMGDLYRTRFEHAIQKVKGDAHGKVRSPRQSA
ncbi:MAG: hypothetical protein EA374_03355 [Acholeplasmatales bacterium]|nr:MAG: hypothetical protein EA374_03355 [Acholeplasmatales bacterium]